MPAFDETIFLRCPSAYVDTYKKISLMICCKGAIAFLDLDTSREASIYAIRVWVENNLYITALFHATIMVRARSSQDIEERLPMVSKLHPTS